MSGALLGVSGTSAAIAEIMFPFTVDTAFLAMTLNLY
jgi:hypothetical protein